MSAQQHFEAAGRAHREGRLDEAEAHLSAVLETHPGHVGTLQRLAVVLAQTGRFARAAEVYQQLVALAPGDAAAHINLGYVLYALGRASDALPWLEKAVALAPDSAEAHVNLGNVLAQLNRPEEALSHYARALALKPGLAEPHNNVGNVLTAAGRHQEAVEAFRKALALRPDFAEAWDNLGNALAALGRHDEAITAFERALALQPASATTHSNFGTTLAAVGRHEEAVAHFERALALRPEYSAALNNLGNSLRALRRPEESLAAFERLLALDPALPHAHFGAGSALQVLGRVEPARRAFEQAVALAPDSAMFQRALAETKRFRADDPQLAAMEALAQRASSLPDGERIELGFALAKAYDDVGRADEAFEQLRVANTFKRRMIAYDEAAELAGLAAIARAFTAEAIRAGRGAGDPSSLPIFIVGMPRSGTTLAEQLLAAHPSVFGAGELVVLPDLVADGLAGTRFPFDFALVSAESLRALGSAYVAALRRLAPSAERVADKLPANFRLAGLIHLALPNARIIHVQRDPLDACWSCYTKLFPLGLEYTFDLGELGRYYRAYEELMTHWRQVLPAGAMLEVRYEDLVADFEAQARRIVGFCGLDWNARCLRFYEVDRPVYTASGVQVREPLSASSVGRWRRYESHLGPLRQALEHPKGAKP